jgi:addiction module RelE/StbE family toxin
MQFLSNRAFDRKYLKLNQKIQAKFKERKLLFSREPNCRILNIHKLSGKYEGMWSINITGDYRAIFDKVNEYTVIFINIGTHSELFG